jgi:BirA family biotin operon repressor/biotin-[acetyl-CoA-carboxylase] ligase
MAAALAARGWPEGTVVVAGSQRRGRGRQGRPWHSPPGANLYCSVVLRPRSPVRDWADLSWVIAAAVATTVRAAGAGEVSLKYPNDVVVGGRKLAGVLLETRTGAPAQPALIAGVGLNVNLAEAELPGELRRAATSLRILSGRSHNLPALLSELCAQIGGWYATWAEGGAGAARNRLAGAGLAIAGSADGGGGALEERGDNAG